MPLIEARRKDTGVIVRIPDKWLGHPTLGDPFVSKGEWVGPCPEEDKVDVEDLEQVPTPDIPEPSGDRVARVGKTRGGTNA